MAKTRQSVPVPQFIGPAMRRLQSQLRRRVEEAVVSALRAECKREAAPQRRPMAIDIRRYRRPPTHPGVMLREEFLKPKGVSVAIAARRLDVPEAQLRGLLAGRRRLTARLALRLAAWLRTTPQFWAGLQTDRDLYDALQAERRARARRSA